MLGFLIFYQVYLNLGREYQNRILGNIFDVDVVSINDILIRNNKVLFRFASLDMFYQYEIRYKDKTCKVFLVNKDEDKILRCDCKWEEFSMRKIFDCLDEYQVYLLLREFL